MSLGSLGFEFVSTGVTFLRTKLPSLIRSRKLSTGGAGSLGFGGGELLPVDPGLGLLGFGSESEGGCGGGGG
jgi:hypothetical protein